MKQLLLNNENKLKALEAIITLKNMPGVRLNIVGLDEEQLKRDLDLIDETTGNTIDLDMSFIRNNSCLLAILNKKIGYVQIQTILTTLKEHLEDIDVIGLVEPVSLDFFKVMERDDYDTVISILHKYYPNITKTPEQNSNENKEDNSENEDEINDEELDKLLDLGLDE